MTQQRILRQVIELEGCPPGTDALLRERLGGMAQRHLLPVIERALAALDGPGRLLRAEHLVLDLGAVPLSGPDLRSVDDDWAQALAERLDQHLRPALAASLQATDPHQADLELLAQFIDSGSLPWWADLQAPGLVAQALQRVLADARAVQALRALGLAGAGSAAGACAAAWQRLLAATRPAEREAWLDALLPGPAGALWRPWLAALQDAGPPAGVAGGHAAAAWWALMLPLAARWRLGDGPDPSHEDVGAGAWTGAAPPGALAAMVEALAQALAWPLRSLRAAWRRAFDRRLAAQGAALAVGLSQHGRQAAAWWQALGDDPDDGQGQAAAARSPVAAEPAPDSLRQLAAALPDGAAVGRLLAVLQTHWALWPAPARAAAARALQSTAATAGRDDDVLARLDDHAWQALAGLARLALDSGHLSASWRDALLWAARAGGSAGGAAVRLEAALRQAEAGLAGRAGPSSNNAADRVDRRFADTEHVAVLDAGLVLLWPFLPAFLARLGWLASDGPRAGRQFTTPAHAARAAMLLHTLAQGLPPDDADADADAAGLVPEHRLPLAKLLCGLAPEAPLPLAPLPGGEALAEGAVLLQAVIAQAPILRAMSVPAFCASFLWRAGHLGVRDGHWLLRVERSAYDMVRDRFPWGVAMVRLPWMPAPLAVEW